MVDKHEHEKSISIPTAHTGLTSSLDFISSGGSFCEIRIRARWEPYMAVEAVKFDSCKNMSPFVNIMICNDNVSD